MQIVQDEIVTVAGCNDQMSQAIDDARASMHQFFASFENPQPNQSAFLIKARFEEDGAAEHIWLADLNFRTSPATGVIANEPSIKSVTYMERVPFLPDQVSDWMFMEDGKLIGGFTTRVLLRAKAKPSGLLDLLRHRLKM